MKKENAGILHILARKQAVFIPQGLQIHWFFKK
jgi:hypothetical protein